MIIKTECTFENVWDKLEKGKDSINSNLEPKSKIGHYRADHDGYKWYGQFFCCNNDLRTNEIIREIDIISKYVLEDLFSGKKGLDKMFDYCESHPEAAIFPGSNEYNFYINCTHTDFWMRCRKVEKGDYQIYIHSFRKDMSAAQEK